MVGAVSTAGNAVGNAAAGALGVGGGRRGGGGGGGASGGGTRCARRARSNADVAIRARRSAQTRATIHPSAARTAVRGGGLARTRRGARRRRARRVDVGEDAQGVSRRRGGVGRGAAAEGDKREGTRSHRGGRGDVPRGEKPAQKRGRGGAVGIRRRRERGKRGRERGERGKRGAGEAGAAGTPRGAGAARGRECCKPRRRSGAPPPRERPRRRSRRLSRRRGVTSSPRTVPSARCPPSARARRKKC